MPRRTVLLDTSFILALENKDDLHHERAKALDSELLKEDAVLLLHWGILFEIADGYACKKPAGGAAPMRRCWLGQR